MELSASDIEAIRKILEKKRKITEKEVESAIGRSIPSIKTKITKFRSQFLDKSITSEALANTVNNCAVRKPASGPKNAEIEKKQIISDLPPKMRAKVPQNHKAQEAEPSMQQGEIELNSGRSMSAEFSNGQRHIIPTLPRIQDSPVSPSKSHQNIAEPQIGSLAVVLYKYLGPAHICRVLSCKMENDTKYYLIAFFQKGIDPCFVLGDYLYQLKTNIGFPLGDESKWISFLEKEEISVDWLLEHIYSAAQNVIISHADILFPSDQLDANKVKPEPTIVQQILFQGVAFAALLLVCFIAGKWEIPNDKLKIIVQTILKTNGSKFASTQAIIEEISKTLNALLSLS